jgi:glutamate formiminotransferase / 5-formyltetrahydrofolate cyclo-ligase
MRADIVECVVNVSEGRDEAVLAEFAEAAGTALLDVHRDPDHHRSVFTLAGAADLVAGRTRALAATAVATLTLQGHAGAHPRLGVLDVVPFVPFRPGGPPPGDLSGAVELRDDFARWLGTELGVPVFLYGPRRDGSVRTLPDIRRRAFSELVPDHGPKTANPRAGASAVGARPVLVAYNVWVSSPALARTVAASVRSNEVRALGLTVGSRAQVSCNLVEPLRTGPTDVYDEVARRVTALGGSVLGAELVGLVPQVVLDAVPRSRRAELGLSDDATVEARLPN